MSSIVSFLSKVFNEWKINRLDMDLTRDYSMVRTLESKRNLSEMKKTELNLLRGRVAYLRHEFDKTQRKLDKF